MIYLAKKYSADNFEPKSNYLYIVIVYSVLALQAKEKICNVDEPKRLVTEEFISNLAID